MAKAKKNAQKLAQTKLYRDRRSFAKIPDVMDVPNLIAIQTESFEWFKTEGENPWKVVLNDDYEGTITVGDETKAFLSLTDVFEEVRKAKEPVVIRMLQDATVDEVLRYT